MIRKKIFIAMLCIASVAGAQNIAKQVIASQFNNWRASGSVNLVVGANLAVTVSPCAQAAGGTNFSSLAASTPIKIWDPGNTAIDEIITPTAVSGCTATFTAGNAHPTPWYITSGTGGLQEAINSTTLSGQINPVILDTVWHQGGWNQQTAYSAAGSYNAPLLDVTIAPAVAFRWNGTHYIITSSPNGLTSTFTVGAGAGTSPTAANATGASGNLMVANVTTGTATTTGTLFTETVTASPNSSGNISCTAQSVGANPFPVALALTPASTTVATFTVTVAPPVSTAYIFAISCN